MTSDHQRLPPELPEWRRSGRFILLAIALHAALLFYPANVAMTLQQMPPNTVMVQLTPAATSLAEPEKPQPPAAPAKARQPAHVSPKTPAVIAMTPEQSTPLTQSITMSPPTPVATPSAPPAALPATPPTPPTVTSISPARFDAAYLENSPPSYPSISRRRGEEGKVLLRVSVSPDGRAATVDIEKSSNFVRLDEAARLAVSRWRFIPAKRGEKSIEASVIVPIIFRLDS